MNVFQEYPELGEAWFRNNQTMMMITGLDGEIYAINDAFSEFIGYSEYEFTRQNKPITWKEITLPGIDLVTDMEEALRCFHGQIKTYKMRKHYIPKLGLPHFVEICVHRYPIDGGSTEFKFFFVEIYSLTDEGKMILKELRDTQKQFAEDVQNIAKAMMILAGESQLWKWAKENTQWSIPIALLVSFLLFGRSILEIVHLIKELF